MRNLSVVSFQEFTFDPASGDLTRNGKRLRVPHQTSRLLGILVERAGTVVTRDELQQVLWPDGEFLDHDHAINRVINHLRYVLRDDTRNPRFIETVPKRGYRFLAQVFPVVAQESTSAMEISPESSAEQRLELVIPEVLAKASPASDLQTPGPEDGVLLHVSAPMIASSKPFLSKPYIWLSVAAALLAVLTVSVAAVMHLNPVQPEVVRLGIAPFQSLGSGAEQLGEGFRLDLADALSQLPAVEIRATNSLSNGGRDDINIRNLSETLHLDMLLLGKFVVQGNDCTVQFELVRGRDAVHLASFQYHGSREELAIIRDRVQRDVFLNLQGKQKSVQAVRGSTINPQAYAEYLQARELTQVRNPESLDDALAHYRSAVARDPSFAQAYAGMATANLNLRYFSRPLEHQREAQRLAEQSLRLDPTLAEAHAVLGDVAFRQDWDFRVGENELRRAVELEPNEPTYHAWLAGLLADEGRADEAIRQIDLAIADDPLWPSVYSMAAFVDGAARDNDRMIAAVHKYVELVPDSAWCHDQLAWAYFAAKRYDDALSEWRKMAAMEQDKSRMALEDRGLEAYRRGGIAAYAAVRLDAIEQGSVDGSRHANDFVPAEWYAFTGHRDQAISALRRTVAEHDGEAVGLGIDSMFDNLRDDPRFQDLLHQVGLTLPSESSHRTLRASR